jgi:cytochrome P450
MPVNMGRIIPWALGYPERMDSPTPSALTDPKPEPAPPAWLPGFSLVQPPPGFVDNPYPFYAQLRQHAPVHAIGTNSVLLTRYADVIAVYRHPAASSDKQREFAPKFGDGSPLFEHHTTSLVFNDAPLHTRVRRLLMGALNQRAIARMEAGVVALVDGLLDRMASLPAPDLIEDFAARIPVEVIGNLLDVPHAERGPLQAWSLAILSALEPAPSADVLARGHAAVRDFLAYLRGLVAQRRAQPGDPEVDVLTRLIQGEVGGERLTEAELLHNCIFLLNAGHETTTNLIGNGMHALMTHRGELQRLAADPALLPSAVEELLRYESPLQLNNRLATAPIELPRDGRVIPAGTFITLGVGAANRDPAAFPEPDRLDVARKPNLQIAFGHSAHACAGMNVARLEARIAIGRLLARFPGIALSGPPERDPRVRFRGFRRLPVRLG